MYMGVIPGTAICQYQTSSIPHVYGGDPKILDALNKYFMVFPMYMGVILFIVHQTWLRAGIPHVYGGDPCLFPVRVSVVEYSPCIWG